jgi:hypothetical protein
MSAGLSALLRSRHHPPRLLLPWSLLQLDVRLGAAMATVMLSVCLGQAVGPHVAVLGEVDLEGAVTGWVKRSLVRNYTPVGGCHGSLGDETTVLELCR